MWWTLVFFEAFVLDDKVNYRGELIPLGIVLMVGILSGVSSDMVNSGEIERPLRRVLLRANEVSRGSHLYILFLVTVMSLGIVTSERNISTATMASLIYGGCIWAALLLPWFLGAIRSRSASDKREGV